MSCLPCRRDVARMTSAPYGYGAPAPATAAPTLFGLNCWLAWPAWRVRMTSTPYGPAALSAPAAPSSPGSPAGPAASQPWHGACSGAARAVPRTQGGKTSPWWRGEERGGVTALAFLEQAPRHGPLVVGSWRGIRGHGEPAPRRAAINTPARTCGRPGVECPAWHRVITSGRMACTARRAVEQRDAADKRAMANDGARLQLISVFYGHGDHPR